MKLEIFILILAYKHKVLKMMFVIWLLHKLGCIVALYISYRLYV